MSERKLVPSIQHSLTTSDSSEDLSITNAFLERIDVEGDFVFSQPTRESYLKEFRRLLIFCSIKNKGFRDLTYQDSQDYVRFIKSPPEALISNKKLPANHPDWKPFYSPLTGASIRQAIAPLKSLWTFLQRTGYLALNPWALITTKTNKVRSESALRKLRVVPTDLIKAALKYLEHSTPSKKLNRQKWLFSMYLYTGSRLSDLIKHQTDSFQLTSSKGQSFWVFNHRSKGGVFHSIPVPKVLIKELKAYRNSLGKSEFPETPEPLVFSLSGYNGVSHRSTIHNEMKDLFESISVYVRETKGSEYALVFKKASTHWLKHSYVSIALDVSDGDIRRVTDLARHADWKTTKAYDHSELGPLADITEKIAESLSGN